MERGSTPSGEYQAFKGKIWTTTNQQNAIYCREYKIVFCACFVLDYFEKRGMIFKTSVAAWDEDKRLKTITLDRDFFILININKIQSSTLRKKHYWPKKKKKKIENKTLFSILKDIEESNFSKIWNDKLNSHIESAIASMSQWLMHSFQHSNN